MSPGPAGSLVVVAVSAASTAARGSTLPVETQIVVLSDGPRIVVRSSASALEVLKAGAVVARTPGSGGLEVPTPLRAGRQLPAQTVPASIRLVGCDGAPLPAGDYTVRAVVGYGSDPLNNAAGGTPGSFALASDPVPLTIR